MIASAVPLHLRYGLKPFKKAASQQSSLTPLKHHAGVDSAKNHLVLLLIPSGACGGKGDLPGKESFCC